MSICAFTALLVVNCCQPLQPRLRWNCKSPAILRESNPHTGFPVRPCRHIPIWATRLPWYCERKAVLGWKKTFLCQSPKTNTNSTCLDCWRLEEKHGKTRCFDAWQSHTSWIDWKWVFFPVSYLFLGGKAFKTCLQFKQCFCQLLPSWDGCDKESKNSECVYV